MIYMNYALQEAKKAFAKGEIPVGAVIVKSNQIIAKAHNTSENNNDCTCHAEINAIRIACNTINSKTLDNCEMYVTLEPCAMCAGAIINARIKRLYIGAHEAKTGACESKVNLMHQGLFNHNVEVYYGISEEESKKLMRDFFEDKRS